MENQTNRKCDICDYQGEFPLLSLKDEWHPQNNYQCPQCKSQNRHRLIWKVIEEIKPNFTRTLITSPMKCLQDKIRPLTKIYHSIDLPPRETESGVTEATLEMDLCQTIFPDNYFDLIISSHVIDQIKDEHLARQELARILKDDGTLIVAVPIYKNETTTALKGRIVGHWWRCGLDYFDRYFDNGFTYKLFEGEEDYVTVMKKKQLKR